MFRTSAICGRRLPQSVIERLRFLAQNDVSADVRVEAVTALANLGLAAEMVLTAAITMAQEQANREEKIVKRKT